MGNLLKISLISLLLCSCSSTYQISSNEQINDIKYNYEELYLDRVYITQNETKNIEIDEKNWKIIKTNLIKIHYHILKIQEQLNAKNESI